MLDGLEGQSLVGHLGGDDESGLFLRTLAGVEQFCAFRSYLATAVEHGIKLLRSPRHVKFDLPVQSPGVPVQRPGRMIPDS